MSFNGYFSVHGITTTTTTTIMTMTIMMIMAMMREPCSPPEAMPIMVCVMMMREVGTCTHNMVRSGHMRPPQSWGRTTWKILGCMKCQAGSIILAP